MAVYILPEEPLFPAVDEAETDGLVAIGGDLSPQRLLNAYASGIFPWFMEENEIFWYSPDPRLILYPCQFKVSDSLGRVIKSNRFSVRFDTAFSEVITRCATASRPDQDGTWINEDFIAAYTELHRLGFAHSAETYLDGQLVGGLYGISLGGAFFGESMFSIESNASKVAFQKLCKRCCESGFKVIDCQVDSEHLRRLGATLIQRTDYLTLLSDALKYKTLKGIWV